MFLFFIVDSNFKSLKIYCKLLFNKKKEEIKQLFWI